MYLDSDGGRNRHATGQRNGKTAADRNVIDRLTAAMNTGAGAPGHSRPARLPHATSKLPISFRKQICPVRAVVVADPSWATAGAV